MISMMQPNLAETLYSWKEARTECLPSSVD